MMAYYYRKQEELKVSLNVIASLKCNKLVILVRDQYEVVMLR